MDPSGRETKKEPEINPESNGEPLPEQNSKLEVKPQDDPKVDNEPSEQESKVDLKIEDPNVEPDSKQEPEIHSGSKPQVKEDQTPPNPPVQILPPTHQPAPPQFIIASTPTSPEDPSPRRRRNKARLRKHKVIDAGRKGSGVHHHSQAHVLTKAPLSPTPSSTKLRRTRAKTLKTRRKQANLKKKRVKEALLAYAKSQREDPSKKSDSTEKLNWLAYVLHDELLQAPHPVFPVEWRDQPFYPPPRVDVYEAPPTRPQEFKAISPAWKLPVLKSRRQIKTRRREWKKQHKILFQRIEAAEEEAQIRHESRILGPCEFLHEVNIFSCPRSGPSTGKVKPLSSTNRRKLKRKMVKRLVHQTRINEIMRYLNNYRDIPNAASDEDLNAATRSRSQLLMETYGERITSPSSSIRPSPSPSAYTILSIAPPPKPKSLKMTRSAYSRLPLEEKLKRKRRLEARKRRLIQFVKVLKRDYMIRKYFNRSLETAPDGPEAIKHSVKVMKRLARKTKRIRARLEAHKLEVVKFPFQKHGQQADGLDEEGQGSTGELGQVGDDPGEPSVEPPSFRPPKVRFGYKEDEGPEPQFQERGSVAEIIKEKNYNVPELGTRPSVVVIGAGGTGQGGSKRREGHKKYRWFKPRVLQRSQRYQSKKYLRWRKNLIRKLRARDQRYYRIALLLEKPVLDQPSWDTEAYHVRVRNLLHCLQKEQQKLRVLQGNAEVSRLLMGVLEKQNVEMKQRALDKARHHMIKKAEAGLWPEPVKVEVNPMAVVTVPPELMKTRSHSDLTEKEREEQFEQILRLCRDRFERKFLREAHTKMRHRDLHLHNASYRRKALYEFMNSGLFNRMMLCLIFFSTLLIILLTFEEVYVHWSYYLLIMDALIIGVFTVEAGCKIYLYRERYLMDIWNVLDIIIILTHFVEVTVDQITRILALNADITAYIVFKFLKSLRSLRLLRAIKFLPHLQVIVSTIFQSMLSLGSIAVLMCLFIFVFAVMGRGLFDEDDPSHYGDIWRAVLTLFQLLTLDDWFDIQEAADSFVVMFIYLFCYIVIEYFVFLNLFVAVLVDNFQLALEEASGGPVVEQVSFSDPAAMGLIRTHEDFDLIPRERIGKYKFNALNMNQYFPYTKESREGKLMSSTMKNLSAIDFETFMWLRRKELLGFFLDLGIASRRYTWEMPTVDSKNSLDLLQMDIKTEDSTDPSSKEDPIVREVRKARQEHSKKIIKPLKTRAQSQAPI